MAKKKRELPEPPGRAFGPFGRRTQGSDPPATSDMLASAMAQGRLDEFLEEEFGDNPHAKNLAMMMLGSTGMMPAQPSSGPNSKPNKSPRKTQSKKKSGAEPSEVPAEIRSAAEQGDIKGLADLLSAEMEKRIGAKPETAKKAKKSRKTKAADETQEGEAVIDKSVIDTLVKIASENDVSLDWVLFRALKLYARDYQTTGRI